jgi:hypothetical protein
VKIRYSASAVAKLLEDLPKISMLGPLAELPPEEDMVIIGEISAHNARLQMAGLGICEVP